MRYTEIINESPQFTLSAQSKRSGETMVKVNVQKVNASWERDTDFYISKGGEGGIKGRYGRFGEFMASTDQAIEVSELGVGKNGQVFFTNGRHRFAYMRDQGATVIPVAMDSESIQNAQEFGYLA